MARPNVPVLALALVLSSLTALSVEANGTSGAHRIRLADLCPEALPWTDAAPLPLPARRPRDAQGVPMIVVTAHATTGPGPSPSTA